MKLKAFNAMLLAGACAIHTAPGLAQETNDKTTGVGEIIVTAQRREQKLQDVPIAVSAVTNAALEAKGIENTLDLAGVVPGLSFTSTAGSTQVRMRGVGTSNFGPGVENPVAIYIDGVYIASTAGAFFNLANIERVEALKGPQGTLFGRNATGGLVQVVTPDPKFTSQGMIKAGYGNYDTKSLDFYVTGPVSETIAADVSFHYQGEGKGWGRNVNTGNYVNQIKDDLIARSKILFQPSDSVRFVLTGDYSYLLGSRPVTLQNDVNAGGVAGGGIGTFEKLLTNRADNDPSNDLPLINHGGYYDNSATVDPRAEITSYGTSLTGTFDIADKVSIKSITAFRKTRFEDDFDIERVPQAVIGFSGVPKWKQFSQELQLNGRSGNLDYTAGAYYFNSTDRYDPFNVQLGPSLAFILLPRFPGAVSAIQTLNSVGKTESISGYGQATYEFLPSTHVTLGGRYTHETKKVGGTQQFSVDFGAGYVPLLPEGTPYASSSIDPKLSYNNFSYRIALDTKVTRDIMAYASYSTGFKSGGYNLTEPANPAYDPEKLKAAEVGLKMELFDRNLRLNLSAYHYDYSNIQVNNFVLTSAYIVNAAQAKIDGVEAEFEARLFRGLNVNGGISYANHRFVSFPNADFNAISSACTPTGVANPPCKGDASGNRLQGAPWLTYNLGFSYEAQLGSSTLGLNGNWFHSQGYYGTFDEDPRNRQLPYDVVNSSVYFEPGDAGLRFTLWAKNLFNEKYAANRYMSSQQATYQAAAPRTYGISVEKKF